MPATKADIIARLQREILPLQGFRQTTATAVDVGLGPMKFAFPNATFPLGAVHEFICTGAEGLAPSTGFVAGILSSLMHAGGAVIWLSASRKLFPPAVKSFGMQPEKIIFIDLPKERDVLWAMEEALKCEGLAAVVGEIAEISFTVSRRLQLAVEQSRVTGFILRQNPRNITTTACITRWQITSLPSSIPTELPGIGFPCWNVSLLKVRNGKPGSWQLEWAAGRFRHSSSPFTMIQEESQKKAG